MGLAVFTTNCFNHPFILTRSVSCNTFVIGTEFEIFGRAGQLTRKTGSKGKSSKEAQENNADGQSLPCERFEAVSTSNHNRSTLNSAGLLAPSLQQIDHSTKPVIDYKQIKITCNCVTFEIWKLNTTVLKTPISNKFSI